MVKKFNKIKANKRAIDVAKDYLRNFEGQVNVNRAILFGSAARGEMHRDSDVDLIVISPDFRNMEFIDRLVLLSRLRRGMRVTAAMDILGYTKEEFKKLRKESVVLSEAWREGVTIKK